MSFHYFLENIFRDFELDTFFFYSYFLCFVFFVVFQFLGCSFLLDVCCVSWFLFPLRSSGLCSLNFFMSVYSLVEQWFSSPTPTWRLRHGTWDGAGLGIGDGDSEIGRRLGSLAGGQLPVFLTSCFHWSAYMHCGLVVLCSVFWKFEFLSSWSVKPDVFI